MPFEIKTFKSNIRRSKTNYSKSIPQPDEGAFRLMITGSSGSGKTVLLINLLIEMKKYFKKLVVFSPNLSQYNRILSKYLTRHDKLIENYSDDKLEREYNKMVLRNRKRKKADTPMLLVFDDQLNLIQNSSIFKELLLVSRKENVSMIFTTHKYVFGSPLIRQNITHFVLMSSNKIELRLIAQYLSIESDKLFEIWKDNIKNKYEFLYIKTNPLEIYFKFSDKQLLN